MFSLIGTFALLSCIIVLAGVTLTRFADKIAETTAMGHSLAGLLLLAGATSLPELSIGWAAVRIDAADLAVGELLGSCLWNLLLLALLDLAIRTSGRMLSSQSAAHALTATVSILLVGIAAAGLVLRFDGTFLRLSPASWAILISYWLCIRLVYQDHRNRDHRRRTEDQGAIPAPAFGPASRAIAGYICCAAVIFLAAPLLASVTDELADQTGIANTFLGASIVALITSLPEAVTTLTAIRIGQVNMAVANIFGSNAFNLVILAMIDLAAPSSIFVIVSPVHLLTAIAVVIISAVALLGLLYRSEKRFWFIEPDAALVVALVIGALLLVFRATN